MLDALLRDVVAIAQTVTADLQVEVQHERFVQRSKTSKPEYGAPTARKVLLQQVTRNVRKGDETIQATGPITFIENVEVSVEDRLTLPDGRVGVVAYIGGLKDRTNVAGGGFVTEVWVGFGGGNGVTK